MAGLRDLDLGRGRVLPERLLSVRFSRSGGPGGQNVNKLATRVDLRLELEGAVEILGESAVERIRTQLGTRIDGEDRLVVVCDEHRSQLRNVTTAVERLEGMLIAALRPKKRRRPTKPTRASKERRLAEKRRRSETKRRRTDRDD